MKQHVYLDHAASTPLLPQARDALLEGFAAWANPSSPHADGRRARALLEDARARIARALGWDGALLLTSGASEALAIAIGRAKVPLVLASVTEHDAVLRHVPEARRFPVDAHGIVMLPDAIPAGALIAVQHVNSESGVIQPIAEIARQVHVAGAYLLCDCSQSAGKIDLPQEADMIVISAHKFGGPIGVGALLVRNLALIEASGGQEQGYRAGTENMPGALAMAAALETGRAWMADAAKLRSRLDTEIVSAGGIILAGESARIPTIASYRMKGMSARTQLVRFDMAGFCVSAGSACSSGTLRSATVPIALGWDEVSAGEAIRVSLGQGTRIAEIDAFLAAWHSMSSGMMIE